MGDQLVLASTQVVLAVGDVRGPVNDAMRRLSGWVNGNQGLKLAMLLFGGIAVLITIFVLAMRKWKPQSEITQAVNVNTAGLVAVMALGIFLMVPTIAVTLFGAAFGWGMQLFANLVGMITGS